MIKRPTIEQPKEHFAHYYLDTLVEPPPGPVLPPREHLGGWRLGITVALLIIGFAGAVVGILVTKVPATDDVQAEEAPPIVAETKAALLEKGIVCFECGFAIAARAGLPPTPAASRLALTCSDVCKVTPEMLRHDLIDGGPGI